MTYYPRHTHKTPLAFEEYLEPTLPYIRAHRVSKVRSWLDKALTWVWAGVGRAKVSVLRRMATSCALTKPLPFTFLAFRLQ